MCEISEKRRRTIIGDDYGVGSTPDNVVDKYRDDSASLSDSSSVLSGNEDTEDKKRSLRNLNDKLRRDRLNCYISELAELVAPPTPNIKKREKAAVLKLAVNYLRLHHDLAPVCRKRRWRGPFERAENLGVSLLESFGGFLLIVSRRGVLMFASDAIESHLGQIPGEIIGQPVSNILHPEDHGVFKVHLSQMERIPDIQAGKSGIKHTL
ncbi:neuronal PAS domain-containing protein 2-like [Glandiceps talaboti]